MASWWVIGAPSTVLTHKAKVEWVHGVRGEVGLIILALALAFPLSQ